MYLKIENAYLIKLKELGLSDHRDANEGSSALLTNLETGRTYQVLKDPPNIYRLSTTNGDNIVATPINLTSKKLISS